MGGLQLAALIKDVQKNSIAYQVGIRPGDSLLSINGQPICDILDYRFAVGDTVSVEMAITKADGQGWLVDIEKDEDEGLGLDFAQDIFDHMRVCQNRCQFCFIDQLPPGMRPSLRIKDDDYRHSFLFGNFITLSNLKAADWDKIISMRLGPLYVSVHAMDPEVRVAMLNNKRSGCIKQDLERLYRAGIKVHTQIVLCPGLNDGPILQDSIRQLAQLYPTVQSIGIVPVGLTRYREGLPQLKPCHREKSRQLIAQVEDYQREFRKRFGLGLVYLADEFYLQADEPIPSAEYYDDFEQLENGIGLTRCFRDEFAALKAGLPTAVPLREIYIITGVAGEIALEPICRDLNHIAGLSVQTIVVPNRFLGEMVNVTGLLSGRDIIDTLGKHYKGKQLLLPEVLLKAGEELLLDDISLKQIAEASGANLQPVPVKAQALVEAIFNKIN